MKKVLLTTLMLCFGFAFSLQTAQAQCTPDPVTSPGIYPSSDSLPDGCVNNPYLEVVTFAFPPDTTIAGFTLPFDSFVVGSVNNVPSWATWQCDQFMNGCTYITNPPNLTIGCVQIDGTPDAIFNDSIEVVGTAWVTIFGTPTAIDDTIRLNLHIWDEVSCPIVSVEENFETKLDLNVSPNPIAANSRVSFNLPENADVNVGIYDMFGREVISLANGRMNAGYQEFRLADFSQQLTDGVYFLKFDLNGGEFHTTRKLLSFN